MMATRTDFGPPYFREMLPPVIQKNYGQWKYHERVKPGLLKHVAESGDELFTVRVGSSRLVSTDWIRDVCDIADQLLRRLSCASPAATTWSSWSRDETKVEPLIAHLKAHGLPGRRHRARDQQPGPHPGLDSLPHACHRCFRHRQGGDGRPVRVLRRVETAGLLPDLAGLLPEHVRRRPLLRYRHPGHPPQAARGQPRSGAGQVRDPERDRSLPHRRDPARSEDQVADRQRRQVHVLRQLLHHVPRHAAGRSGRRRRLDLGGRQDLQRPHAAEVLPPGDPLPAQHAAALARDRPPLCATSSRPGLRMLTSTSAWANGSTASAGSASSI